MDVEYTKLIKKHSTKQEVEEKVKTLTTRVEKKYEALFLEKSKLEDEIRIEIEEGFKAERKMVKHQKKVYRENIKAMYRKEKQIVEKTILQVQECAETAERISDNMQDQIQGMIKQHVVKAVDIVTRNMASEMIDMKKCLEAIDKESQTDLVLHSINVQDSRSIMSVSIHNELEPFLLEMAEPLSVYSDNEYESEF
eukprot:CAMPEP_0201475520 /NCGR_PEP_ID=MMETSP0151_2-20130828/938_1 /ASSEMBLY_ACC=CAM_ASM_000257 /TAXON_ID=200890 /ORGANISM="Paramoeba atlantica, Strain 621/1 / CCAP 1560/9" /LENGTH=195 /DNA_ID=CAMNT_0047855635 /DNA_START=342 /DNA_END=929 /DNA_ORIENTATION=-